MSNAFAQTDDYAPAPSGNAMALPDLPSDRTTTADQWARLLDTWAAMLGPGFSYKGGIQYENGDFRARLNNRGLKMRGPLAGGTWKGEVSDLGTGDPRFGLKYRRQIGDGEISGSVSDIGGDPRYQLNYIRQFR